MAEINALGNVTAHCPGCDGAKSRFEYLVNGKSLGVVIYQIPAAWHQPAAEVQYRLFRCVGCGMGGLGAIRMKEIHGPYPANLRDLTYFEPDVSQRLAIPKDVPEGIRTEFREAERCLESGTLRAAAAMFRSVLDKTLRANGYKTKGSNLEKQIDEAAEDGALTESRKRRAHDEIRVLGNDVLHDEWHEIPEADVEASHHYVQRILEDFYDDRDSVLKLLREAKRTPDEDRAHTESTPASLTP